MLWCVENEKYAFKSIKMSQQLINNMLETFSLFPSVKTQDSALPGVGMFSDDNSSRPGKVGRVATDIYNLYPEWHHRKPG